MKKNKLISIITVTKNSEKFLKKNIISLLNQSYKNYEHIIIDGGSIDSTIDIVNEFRDKIKYFRSSPDRGIYDAMNKGISVAKGDIIGILNSDDIYYSKTLEIVNFYFNKFPKIDFLFGSVLKHKLLYGFNPKKIYWTFGFYTAHSVGFFIKKKSQKKIGKYNINYKYSADYDLFYRMIVKLKMKGMATKKTEIFGKFRTGGLSSKIRYIDYLIENTKIRIDNNQNTKVVLLIFIYRFLRNIKKIIIEFFTKKKI